MKKLQNLKGAKALNKKEQQSINGGANGCGHTNEASCLAVCISGTCYSFPHPSEPGVHCWECRAEDQ